MQYWFTSSLFSEHWGRVTHICISKITIIGSDNGLSPHRRQAIIWSNAGILLIGPLGTNFSEIYIEILTFSFKKMRLKVSSAKWRPFCLGLNVLKQGVIFLCLLLRNPYNLFYDGLLINCNVWELTVWLQLLHGNGTLGSGRSRHKSGNVSSHDIQQWDVVEMKRLMGYNLLIIVSMG